MEKQCSGCDGTDFELRRRTLGNGSIQFVHQCTCCGRAVSNPVPRASIRNVASLPAWDDSLAGRFEHRRAARRDADRAEWFREHNAYLKSQAWRARRTAVLARAKGICEGCAGAVATQVHHLTYEHWKNEFLWELVAICEDCHERIHPHMSGPFIPKGMLS